MSAICAICTSKWVNRLATKATGYVQGTTFSIYECQHCSTQFVSPMEVPSGLYEAIYKKSEILPGYERYSYFAQTIASQSEPLDWLMSKEPSYYFIGQEIQRIGQSSKILEVGSGLGYLTYALRKAGYDCVGIDLSKDAVDKSTKRFGPFYEAGNVFELHEQNVGAFDAVILTEVIEHVSDPVGFIKGLKPLVRAGGHILVSTPNRSALPQSACWITENPPVHLWWLAESSMQHIAKRCDLGIHFFDFALKSKPMIGPPHKPFLTPQGDILPDVVGSVPLMGRDNMKAKIKARFPEAFSFLKAASRLKQRSSWDESRQWQMGATLTVANTVSASP